MKHTLVLATFLLINTSTSLAQVNPNTSDQVNNDVPNKIQNKIVPRVEAQELRRNRASTQKHVRRLDLEPGTRLGRRNIDPRDFFVRLVPHQIPDSPVPRTILEMLSNQINNLATQLIPALFFFLVTLGWRHIFADDSKMLDRCTVPYRAFLVYFWIAALVVLSGLFWQGIYRFLHLVSLFLLVLGIIQIAGVVIVDGILARSRKIMVPVIVRDVAMIVLYIVASIIVLSNHDVDLTGILTGSVVLTAVVGLAFQDTLGSIASGMAIQLERPYQEGEWVRFEDSVGKVQEINWRSTLLHTLANEVVVVPNKLITAGQLVNLSRPDRKVRRHIDIGLPYSVPPSTCKKILETAARTNGVLLEPSPKATLMDFGDSALMYRLFFYISRVDQYFAIEDRIRTNIWYRLKRAAIDVPFPIRDITVHEARPENDEARERNVLSARVLALSSIPFLAPLNDKERQELAALIREEFYGAGEMVIHQGDQGDSLFFIQSGEVEVLVSPSQSNRPKRVALLGRSDFFGEMSLMTGERRTCTIRTLTDAQFFVIEAHSFREVLTEHAEICAQIAIILEERLDDLETKRREFQSSELAPVSTAEAENLLDRIRSFFGV